MPVSLTLADVVVIGENDHWRFCIGRMDGRWIGFAAEPADLARSAFAAEGLEVQPQMLFVLTEVSDHHQLGLLDRDKAIRMTTAVACDLEADYGGIDRWHVAANLRGKPEDFRCIRCGYIGCDGIDCKYEYWEELDDVP
jgi:hypothetical protein